MWNYKTKSELMGNVLICSTLRFQEQYLPLETGPKLFVNAFKNSGLAAWSKTVYKSVTFTRLHELLDSS